jgi:hypothetical protein
MNLPGGILRGGQRLNDYSFKALTGVEELAIAEAFGSGMLLPQRVTAVLAAALARIGGEVATEAHVSSLAVGDRQFLMQRLVAHLGGETGWLTAVCLHCEAPCDFPLRFADLPFKPAGAGFPFATVRGRQGSAIFRAPTGGDQEVLAAEGLEGAAALRRLVGLCLVKSSGAFDVAQIGEVELAGIDQALEDVSPEAVTETTMVCPSCGKPTRAQLDVTAMPLPSADVLYQEVHRIASVYHWSEHEILSLTRYRRQRYLALIARQYGAAPAVRRSA